MFEYFKNSCTFIYDSIGSANRSIMLDVISKTFEEGSRGYIITCNDSFEYYSNNYPYSIVTSQPDIIELERYISDESIKYIIFDYNKMLKNYTSFIKLLAGEYQKARFVVQYKLYIYNKYVNDNIDYFMIIGNKINYSRIYNNYMDLKYRYTLVDFMDLCNDIIKTNNYIVINWDKIWFIQNNIEVLKNDHEVVIEDMDDTVVEEIIETENKNEINTSRCNIL